MYISNTFIIYPLDLKTTQKDKKIIDISFQNIENDKSQSVFHKNLKYIYDNVYEKYKYDYIVNEFLKRQILMIA